MEERESYIEYCKPLTNKMFQTKSTLFSFAPPHLNPVALVDQTEMWSENGKSADSEIGMSSAQCLIKRQHVYMTQAYK